MHVEKRKFRGKIKYYLAHSYRDGPKVRKIRRYLGVGLSKEQLKKASDKAKSMIEEQLRIYNDLHDPLKTQLTSSELSRLKKVKPVPVRHLDKKDWRAFTQAFTYNTNAIEGSTVTLKEVKGILEDQEWPDASKEEISETYGVAGAVNHIRQIKEHISISLMLKLHKIVFRNSKGHAGRFRKKGVEVVIRDRLGNVIHQGVPSSKIRPMLLELVRWYGKNKKKLPPVVLAAVIHNQFETIHPFEDGNGRLGRLILNNVLMKHGLPPVNIQMKHRKEYYLALQAYQKRDNLRPMVDLILKEYKQQSRKK